MPRRTLFYLPVMIAMCVMCYARAERFNRGKVHGFAETFERAMLHVEKDYVEEVKLQDVFEGAMTGLAQKLDEHSAYYDPPEYRSLTESLEGEFGGIGIMVAIDPETKRLLVSSPLVGSPAHQAGILGGDSITAIDGKPTAGMTLKQAAESMRGEIGSNVKVRVAQADLPEPRDVELRRSMIHVESVLGDRRNEKNEWEYHLPGEDGVAYVRVASFGEQTSDEFREALRRIQQKPTRGLIVDLRDNNGGLLRQAVKMVDAFLKEGAIVQTRGRGGKVLESYTADGAVYLPDWPVVVIVNHFSASASEIMAAALQDHGRARIVGERTWGKGSVQKVFPLPGGKDALKLTTGSYWRPSNRNIHRFPKAKDTDPWGVVPDRPLTEPLTKEELGAWIEHRRLRDAILRPGATLSASAQAMLAKRPQEVDRPLREALLELEAIRKGTAAVPAASETTAAAGTGTSGAATSAAATSAVGTAASGAGAASTSGAVSTSSASGAAATGASTGAATPAGDAAKPKDGPNAGAPAAPEPKPEGEKPTADPGTTTEPSPPKPLPEGASSAPAAESVKKPPAEARREPAGRGETKNAPRKTRGIGPVKGA